VLDFAMNWILWAGILILVAKLFNEDLGRWNVFFVIIGYSFIATVVYTLISVAPLSALPPLNVPLDANAFNALLDASWRPLLAYQLWLYIPILGQVWIAALGAVAIRVMKEITWSKAATIASVAFAIRFLLSLFLGF
jgi:ABC-type protease/lipase transport system fused ATPase/permease subunit